MRWPVRALLGLAVLAGVMLAGAATARADITYTPNAQGEFGIDADGNPTGDAASTTLTDGWTRFWRAPEGQRIHTYLDLLENVEVVVDVLPADEVGSGDAAGKAYGTAKIVERDENGRPTRILIKIRNERTGGAANLADTIWHEFRHAEIFVNGNDEDEHDELDGEGSAANLRFRADSEAVAATSTTLDPSPPTPHYDRIMSQATGSELQSSAWLLGDILEDIRDSISFNEPQFTEGYIDIEWYGVQKYTYDQVGVDLTFNESIFECGEDGEDRVVVCADTVLPMPAGEVLVAAIVVEDPIPLRSGDRSLIYSAVFDSNGDEADDWRYVDPFDWDYFQGADRWYQLIYDHTTGAWSVTVTQLGAAGSVADAAAESSVRVVVEGDTVVFFVSMDEFDLPSPGYRLTAFGHDGFFTETDRGGDVSGDLPSDPLLTVRPGTIPAEPVG